MASQAPVSTPWNAQWHLRAEMARVAGLLTQILRAQRERGRGTDAKAAASLTVEPREAEGLAEEMLASWSGSQPGGSPDSPLLRLEIAERAGLGVANGCFLPLRRAVVAFELEAAEYDALLLALAVELDPRCGRIVAYLNDHAGNMRPTLGLAAACAELGGSSVSPLELCGRPFIRDGLIEIEGDGPAPSLAMRLDSEIAARLAGSVQGAPASPGVALHFAERGLLARMVLAEPVRERLARWASAMRELRAIAPLVIAGSPGSGRTTAAIAAAAEAGFPVVEVEVTPEDLSSRLRLGRRESRWFGAALLLKAAPAEGLDWRTLWKNVHMPVMVEVDSRLTDAVTSAAPEEPMLVAIEEPGLELRVKFWKAILGPGVEVPTADLESLAGSFQFSPGRMVRALRRARSEAAALPEGQRMLTARLLAAACRWTGSAAMGLLAQKLTVPYHMSDLVVPDEIRAELELAGAWVRNQRKVVEDWGFARRIPFGRGLTALFSGPPGTGKTMAAQVLARELGLDIYRIDLSRVMNKYIGETEKNLARLFDDAHASGAILFFDEADAIFGKRTEVRDAHDRYANVEIGYLLQRMEEHDGVTILATNRMRDMDEAFVRRFHFILNFPMPGEPDRLRIWEGMFPVESEREPNLDLRPLAHYFEISGGEIRNIVLAAAFLAASETQPIGLSQLKRALKRELAKNGRVADDRALKAI